jgi:L-histidine N-alpha-methyltransferase
MALHHTRSPRIEIRNYLTDTYRQDLVQDVTAGLSGNSKSIPCKYFYDDRGSRLFDTICTLPEYYLTRTECSILIKNRREIMGAFLTGDLIEMGSGSNLKISKLIEASNEGRGEHIRYVPVDVSEELLIAEAEALVRTFPKLRVLGIVADFTKGLEIIPADSPKLVIIFGSTIGNFEKEEASRILHKISTRFQDGDRFLIGLDMVKDPDIIEAAYNDSCETTAEFNRNMLHVINRELNADIEPANFEHLAFFNPEYEQVEMHLLASCDMVIHLRDLGMYVELREGETINTEICRKFTEESATRMFEGAGLSVERWFSDPKKWFSLVELSSMG